MSDASEVPRSPRIIGPASIARRKANIIAARLAAKGPDSDGGKK